MYVLLAVRRWMGYDTPLWLWVTSYALTAFGIWKGRDAFREHTGMNRSQQNAAHPEVPGLLFFRDFLSPSVSWDMTNAARRLMERLETNRRASGRPSLRTPIVPMKDSAYSEEAFWQFPVDQPDSKCEFFPRYGEEGHSLAYFRGQRNLPEFVAKDVLPAILDVMVREQPGVDGEPLTAESGIGWRFTINRYQTSNGKLPGFPFHTDVETNGDVTMILNVQREAVFEITDAVRVVRIELPVGSLLILSSESRWQWQHRVTDSIEDKATERISLVLGCRL